MWSGRCAIASSSDALPVGERLPRRAVDEVEADLRGRRRAPTRTTSGTRAGIVRALEGGEHVRHGRLHAEADAREAGRGERRQVGGVDRVRVRLGRDLGAGGDAPGASGCRASIAARSADRQQGRRAAAEEHRRRRAVADARQPSSTPRANSISAIACAGVVALLDPAQLGRGVGVEVAVAAAHPAERHVQVDAEVARADPFGDRVAGAGPSAGAGSAMGRAEGMSSPLSRRQRTSCGAVLDHVQYSS